MQCRHAHWQHLTEEHRRPLAPFTDNEEVSEGHERADEVDPADVDPADVVAANLAEREEKMERVQLARTLYASNIRDMSFTLLHDGLIAAAHSLSHEEEPSVAQMEKLVQENSDIFKQSSPRFRPNGLVQRWKVMKYREVRRRASYAERIARYKKGLLLSRNSDIGPTFSGYRGTSQARHNQQLRLSEYV